MALGSRLTLVVTCLTLVPGPCRAQSDCFSSGNIVGAVLGTFFSTAIALGLLVFLLWWIYYRRSPKGAKGQSKAVESGSGFDNPCFEANPNSDVVDGSKADDYGGRKDAKSTSWTPLRFFGANKSEKKRSMDDSFISEPERVSVQLRGHDFTGLGFNVTGNMRDGIFIKDILNRGPAFESGKFAAGDRILSVTISFRHVVYEDALTILSYASPYDVTMELEKGLRNSSTLKKRKTASTVSLASTSPNVTLSAAAGSVQPEGGPQNERLVHPLYRSQSIDDLSKVGRADTIVRADMRIPSLTGQLGANLATKSKLLGKANIEVEVPDVKIKGGTTKGGVVLDATDISVAPPDASLTVEAKTSKISKFAIKVLPDFKFKSSAKASADLGMTPLPTGLDVPEAELSLPKVEIHVPKATDLALDIDMPDGSAVNLPKPIDMVIDMPQQEFPVAASIDTDVKINIETPSISASAPALALSELKLKEPVISPPSIDASLPAVDLDIKSPDVAVALDVPNPEISVDVSKAVKSGFHIKFPKFGGGGSVKAPKIETPELSVAAPEVEVALPEANLEIDPKLKKEVKGGFEFKMPKLSLKKKAEVNIDAKAPAVSAQIPEVDVDVKMPAASIEVEPLAVSVPDVQVPSVEVKKPKMSFSMPKFGMGGGKSQVEPKESINVAVDLPSAQVDLPQLTIASDEDKKLKLGKADAQLTLPDVSADVEIPSAQLDVDVKGKNKFGFKLPKIGASASTDVDLSAEHDIKLPKVKTSDSSSSSSSSDEDDAEGGDKKKKKFNIKLPKFGSPKVEMDAPSVAVDVPDVKPIEGNLEIGVPNLSADVLRMQSDSSEESDSDDEGKKKKKKKNSGKFLKFKSPDVQLSGDFNAPSLSLPPIAVAGTADVDMDAPSLNVSAPVVSSEIKIKEPAISAPSIDASLPAVDLDIKSPDVAVAMDVPNPEISVDVSKAVKSGFHIKFPKFGGGGSVKAPKIETPELSVAAPEVEVALPEANLEIDPKLKKEVKGGFEFKMPKLSLKKKAEVNIDAKAPAVSAQIPEVDVDVKMPAASIDVQAPTLSASVPDVELPSASVEMKKSKGLSFSMPKFHMGGGKVEAKESINVSVDAPSAQIDLPQVSCALSDDEESGKKKSKFGKMKFGMNKPQVNVPEVSTEIEVPSVQLEDKSKHKFGFKLPKMGASVDVDASAELPEVKADASESSSSSDDDDAEEGGKKKKKFNIKLPKFGSPKAEIDAGIVEAVNVNIPDVNPVEANLQLEAPKLSLKTRSDDSDSDHDEKKKKKGSVAVDIDANLPKKKGSKFGIKFPKLRTKSDSDSDTSSDDSDDEGKQSKAIKVDLGKPEASIELPSVPQLEMEAKVAETETGDSDDEEETKKKSSKFGFSIKMPKFHMKKKSSSNIDIDLDKEVLAQLHVDAESDEEPSSEDNVEKKKGKVSVKLPKFGVKKPDVDADVKMNLPELDIVDKESSFSIKMPELAVEKPKMDIDLDSSAVEVEGVVVPELPEVELEVESDDEKKKSSKFFKMPKFHMGKHHGEFKVEAGKVPDVDLSLPSAKLELDSDADSDDEKKDKKKPRFGIKLPKFQMKHPQVSGDIKPELPSVEVEAGLEGSVSSDGASVDVDLPKVPDVDIEMPEGKKKGKFSFKSNFKMPKLHMSSGHKGHAELEAPSAEISLPKVEIDSSSRGETDEDLDVDIEKKKSGAKFGAAFKMPKLRKSSAESDNSSDDDDEKKKSSGFGFKMPKLSGKAEVDIPDVDVKANPSLELPEPRLEAELPKQSPFIVKMPALSTPGIELDMSAAKKSDSSSDSSDSEDEDKSKKGFKLGFKMPAVKSDVDLETDIQIAAKPELELPSAEVSVVPEAAKKKSSFGAHFKMPSFSTGKTSVEIPAPVDVEVQHETPEDSAMKVGVKVPKFQLRQRDADVPLPQVELKDSSSSSSDEESEKELKVKVKKPKFGIKLPEFNKPKLDVDVPDVPQAEIKAPADIVDIQVGNIDAEVAKVKAQLAQLQAEFDIQSGMKQSVKEEEDSSSSSSSDSESERRTKSTSKNFGLKMPKFSLGKSEKVVETEAKLEVVVPSAKNNGDEMTSPSLSSLEVEPVKLESGGLEKEKKKFSLGLKMPKFQSKAAAVESEVAVETEVKPFKVNVKGPKMKSKKKKGGERSSSSSSSSDDDNNEEDQPTKNKEASGSMMGVEVKLPRVQMYKNVEYQDAGHRDSSSDEEDEVKDIKKNIGARFGVKLKKPKMFSSNKVEITGKNDPANNSGSLQPEWKLPRVDLRRTSKTSDQELSVDVDLDMEQQKLEQLSPSERAEAIRRDSKSSAGIRLHSPSYISLMPSPRSKKPSLETLDMESSPKLLSVTRLDPTPPIEATLQQQPVYGNMELTATMTGPQVSASQVPSSVIMASDAVKMKRGPPTPARRSIIDPNSSVFHVAHPVITTDVTVERVECEDVSSSEMEINQQASDTDLSISTSTGSDTLVISCVSPSSSSAGQQEAHNRKASSLGDLTRIPTSGSEDGSLERTVSLDFKPVSTMAGNSSRAIYNLAVQDLSRVGEDSDEDYNLNRKRTASNDHSGIEEQVTIVTAADQVDGQTPVAGNRTMLTINTDDNNVTLRPIDGADIAEALWFGSTSIQTVESVQTTMSYTQMEESISTDVTLTTTSLGTSPSETSSSSEGSPFSPASPEPSGENTPNLLEHSQVENGRTQQYTEMTELTEGEMGMSGTRTITLEMTSISDDSQPQPLTDLNPSAGNFAAVRNRFEQLSGSPPLNGAETTGSLGRNSGRLSQTQGTVIKRLSGNFEDLSPSSNVNVLQKSFMQHIAPELSEGALSRTVIISSLTLERAEQNSVSPTTGLGPESPVPNLEPPC